ncbi:MAG: aminomethyltransferase family protein [Longimicrobiales bacterium]|nr:aminomethyltransferase family protein [Longimicrobiales bacterium]
MPLTTPFHSRLEEINQTGIWRHWSGYLVAPQYQYSLSNEYYSVRNSVSLLDTSPLFKYSFTGIDAKVLLERILLRDIGHCEVGKAHYTCWCDDRGFVLQDGVVMQVNSGEFWLTAAEPTLRYFRGVAKEMGLSEVIIEDVSSDFGILSLQGPQAYNVISELTEVSGTLSYFDVVQTEIAGCSVTVSRTGYTGDLGYEIWIRSDDAMRVWDALIGAGEDFNITPIGTTALKMVRVEAGLLLMGTDFYTSRFAWVDSQRETPHELGWGWMLKGLENDGRDFIGRGAVEKELEMGKSRWKTVGLTVDWQEYESTYTEAGILPPHHEVYSESTMSIYRRGSKDWDYAGYASSFLVSSLLKKPIAIAKLPVDLTAIGSEVNLEIPVIREPKNVLARVSKMPFFNPPRKTESSGEMGAHE